MGPFLNLGKAFRVNDESIENSSVRERVREVYSKDARDPPVATVTMTTQLPSPQMEGTSIVHNVLFTGGAPAVDTNFFTRKTST